MGDLQGDGYFTATVDTDATPALVTARGEIDSASSRELSTALDQALAAGGGVDLDLSQVTFIDSSGLRVITVTLRRAKEEGVAVRIPGMSDAVRRVFEMTGVDSLLAP